MSVGAETERRPDKSVTYMLLDSTLIPREAAGNHYPPYYPLMLFKQLPAYEQPDL